MTKTAQCPCSSLSSDCLVDGWNGFSQYIHFWILSLFQRLYCIASDQDQVFCSCGYYASRCLLVRWGHEQMFPRQLGVTRLCWSRLEYFSIGLNAAPFLPSLWNYASPVPSHSGNKHDCFLLPSCRSATQVETADNPSMPKTMPRLSTSHQSSAITRGRSLVITRTPPSLVYRDR